MKRIVAQGSGRSCSLALLFALSVAPVPAASDWIPSSLDARCDPSDVDGISNSIRDAIEASVRRAEASIAPPAGIGDLSCLDDLMNAPLDIFSNIGGIMGTLQGGLFSSLSFPVDFDASGMLCQFAAEKWGELTSGLGDANIALAQFANTPSDLMGRMSGGGGFGSGSGSGSGSILSVFGNSTQSSGVNTPTGTIRTDVPVGATTAGIPIFPGTGAPVTDEENFNMAAFQSAYASWLDSRDVALARFQACETARRLASTGGYFGGPGTCPVPSIAPEPSIDSFRISSSGSSPTTTTFAASSPSVTTTSEPFVAPSSLIQSQSTGSSGSGSTGSTGTSSSGETINSIWSQF